MDSLSLLLHHLNSVRPQDPPPTSASPSIAFQLRSSHDAAKAFVSALEGVSTKSALQHAQELEATPDTLNTTVVPLDQDEEERYNPKRRKSVKPAADR